MMKHQDIINIDDATNAQLLKHRYEGPQKFSAQSWSLRYSETDRPPLKALAGNWIAKTAIFAMRRMKAKGEVSILKVH
jgi:hypothetical protein